MSASREKKQRQVAGPSEKVSQAQTEQTAYKKRVRTYTCIGIVVVVLVAALLFWNSGIIQRGMTAATVGDTELTVSDLSYYYYNNQDRVMYSYYGISDSMVYDSEKGTTYRDYFLSLALADAHRVTVLYEDALAKGYSVADVQEDLDAQIASLKTAAKAYGMSYRAYLKANMGRHMTVSTFETQLTRYLIAQLYSTEVYNETFDGLTAEDLEAYYKENPDKVDNFTYSYLYFAAKTVDTKDAEGNALSEDEIATLKSAAMAEAKAKAESVLASYNNGIEIADLIKDNSPYTSVDHTTVTGTSAISSVFLDELLKLDTDEAAIVENENAGYYVIIFHERGREEALAANVRHILFNAETTVDADGKLVAPTAKAWDAAKTEAENALAEFEAGSEQTPEAFGALAEKYSDDTGSKANGGLYENVVPGYFVTELNDWLFGEDSDLKPGDTAVIRHEGDTSSTSSYWGYHVMYLESQGEAVWQLDVRNTLANAALDELQDALIEADPAELTSAASNVGK